MKGIILKVLAGVGIVSLLVAGLRIATAPDSYEEIVRRHFGTPEAVSALVALFDRVEKEGEMLQPAGARHRGIPQAWIRDDFTRTWSTYFQPDVSAVVAHFDDDGALSAIEFIGSRCGGYVSRDPERCPRTFSSLHRLATAPLYVTGVIYEDE